MLLNLLTSSQSSVTKWRSSTWAHLPQLCLLLPSGAGHTLHLTPGWQHLPTGSQSGQLHHLRWVMAFCQLGTIAPWSSWQSYSALPAWPYAWSASPRPCWCATLLLMLHSVFHCRVHSAPHCWHYLRAFFIHWGELGCHCSWPCPGPVSCFRVSHRLLVALSAPPNFPLDQETPLSTMLRVQHCRSCWHFSCLPRQLSYTILVSQNTCMLLLITLV